MQKFENSITISCPIHEVWSAIISDQKYRAWTKVFHENSHFIGEWLPGSELIFSDGSDGMVSELTICDYPHTIELITRGILTNNLPDVTSELALPWIGTTERYHLIAINETTTSFQVEMELNSEFIAEFESMWEQALPELKRVCEQQIAAYDVITIEAVIAAPVTQVWQAITTPELIKQWNFADVNWYCPDAENQLKIGGRYRYTMTARDQSASFDFTGTFTHINPLVELNYLLDDGRFVQIHLLTEGNTVRIAQTFEAETENSLELQKQDWQAILNNFKNFVETHK